MTRVRSIDFAGREWAAHAQEHWLEFAGNPNFPDYLRIVFVAYGRHRANGHAVLERGELARYLVRKDGTLPDRRNQWRAVERAIQLDYLQPHSRALCLVVNSEHVQGGIGDQEATCSRDHTIKKKRTSSLKYDVQQRTSSMTVDVPPSTSSLTYDVPRSASLSLLPTQVEPHARSAS